MKNEDIQGIMIVHSSRFCLDAVAAAAAAVSVDARNTKYSLHGMMPSSNGKPNWVCVCVCGTTLCDESGNRIKRIFWRVCMRFEKEKIVSVGSEDESESERETRNTERGKRM